MGSAVTAFPRWAPAAYDDGISMPAGAARENPRTISNALCAHAGSGVNPYNLSDYVWQWGQFVDHDITLALTASDIGEAFFINVGPGDPLQGIIPLMRTIYDPATGDTTPRQQVNSITSFLDASMVYGSDGARAAALRTFSGGMLKTSAGDLMPFNTTGLPNANDLGLPEGELFLGGDVRANEQLGLTCVHTVFVREHNRLAAEIAAANPSWDDHRIYQRARRIVGAQIQSITYNEWLPALLGAHAPDPAGFVYDPDREPGISNEFASAIYRFGHSMVSDQMLMMGDDGQPAPQPVLAVLEAFFNPSALVGDPVKLDWILKGLSMQLQQDHDPMVVDNLRNQLFGPAGAGGLDLAALNIQRGRDHGLASYNTTRSALGLAPKASFAEVSSDPGSQAALASVYADVDQIDLWVGCLIEDHLEGACVGELSATAMRRQFTDLAEGDRFFYRFDPELAELVEEIEGTRLADIIMRNSGITSLQRNVFYVDAGALALGTAPAPLADHAVSISAVGGGVELLLTGADPGVDYLLQRSVDGVAWETIGGGSAAPDGRLRAADGAVPAQRSALYRFLQR